MSGHSNILPYGGYTKYTLNGVCCVYYMGYVPAPDDDDDEDDDAAADSTCSDEADEIFCFFPG